MLELFTTDAMTLKVGKYQHFSGKQYEVLGVGRHSETLEEVVVYKAVVESFEIWVRTLQMFIVTLEIDGKVLPRFMQVE